MHFHNYWWLGLFGLIGIYRLPDAPAAFNGDKGANWISLSDLASLLCAAEATLLAPTALTAQQVTATVEEAVGAGPSQLFSYRSL